MTRREFFQRRIPRYRKDPLLFFKEVTHFDASYLSFYGRCNKPVIRIAYNLFD